MSNYLSKIFRPSPVVPIQEHCDKCYKAARELLDFFAHVHAGDWEQVEASRQKIVTLENEADELKRQVRSRLPKGLFMPVAREDLLDLVVLQDKIANRARDISGLVLGRRMTIPEPIQEKFLAFVSRNVDAAKKARKTIRELDELYETRFRGSEADLVESLVEELDAIENDTDAMQIEIRGMLIGIEKELDPIDVMFLYRVIEMVGDVADRAEVVGRRLETLLSR